MNEFDEITIGKLTLKFEDLEEFCLEELSPSTVSVGYIFYLIPRTKKPFLLLDAGDIITEEFIQKYKDKNVKKLWIYNIGNKAIIEKYRTHFLNLKKEMQENNRRKLANQLLIDFHEDFFTSKENTFLDFAAPCFEVLNNFPIDEIIKMRNESVELYFRSLITSACSVLTLLLMRSYDFKLVQDLYHCSFFLDVGLLDGNFDYFTLEACESERLDPGSGVVKLSEDCPLESMLSFVDHPKFSFEFLEKNKQYLNFENLAELVLYHHEKNDGSGFPNGISYNIMSDYFNILSYSDYVTPFKSIEFRCGDTSELLIENIHALQEINEKKLVPLQYINGLWAGYMAYEVKKVVA